MKKKTFIIIGNGFSIGLIEKLKKEDKINLKNLFALGDQVKWPKSNEKGFLSRQHLPDLWTLGARPTMSNQEAADFINEIITCMNVYNLVKNKDGAVLGIKEDNNIYFNAYNQLCTYFKNLFIYYNNLVKRDELEQIADKVPLIQYIKKEIKEGNEIIAVTYNYDIFLERLLEIEKIPFMIEGINKSSKINKVRIIKPHGSISFSSKTASVSKEYIIKNIFDSVGCSLKEIKLDYDLKEDESIICAIIPPAGDSGRVLEGWSKYYREHLEKYIKDSTERDSLIFYGLSYDHVDRMEMDNIITRVNPGICVTYVNPYPSKTLDAVLSSIFENYIQLKEM